MAPISDNVMYSAARQGISLPNSLRILTLEKQHSELPLHFLTVLHNYLADLRRGDVRIELFTAVDTPEARLADFATVIPFDVNDQQEAIKVAIAQNIDIIHDPKQLFSKKDRFKLKDSFAFTTSPQEFATQVESYLTGHDIAWELYEPVWHNSWVYKYVRSGGLSRAAYDFIATGQQKNYTDKQIAYVRSLANKVLYIEHARELLYFYTQLKRSAYRQRNPNNDFSFELVYQLSNYTFFICGAMDVLARLINDLYSLGYGKFQNYSIEKTDFIAKLAPKRKALAYVFNLKKYQNWMGWMKVRRNNLAHESHVYLTPLVKRKDKPLTDAELERKVDEALDWQYLQLAGMNEQAAALRATVKQNLDLQLNYDQVVADMMTLERIDPMTGQAQTYIVFPLRTIDEDFAKINEIIDRALSNLSEARKRG